MSEPSASLTLLADLGQAWRVDWSEFDGRLLRTQLDGIADLIRRECEGEDVREAVDGQYVVLGICPKCRSWTSWCECA